MRDDCKRPAVILLCATAQMQAIKCFQVSLQGHTGQRPASYILLKSFKGLFVCAAMTHHTENNLSIWQKKRLSSQNSLSSVWDNKQKKIKVCLQGGIDA